jgi:hypothetical protein
MVNDSVIRPVDGEGGENAPLPSLNEPPGMAPPRGPTWKGWVVSIVAAVILSAAATILLGGWPSPGPFRSAGTVSSGACGGPCCAPAGGADSGK